MTKIAKWTSLHPATRFGLTTKGKIAVGMDADLAIVSLNDSYEVTEHNFLQNINKVSISDTPFLVKLKRRSSEVKWYMKMDI